MKQQRPSVWLVLLAMVALALGLYAPDALAAADDWSSSYSCSGGVASGQLFKSAASCPTTFSFDNMASFLICNFEQLASNVLGQMFCGMILNLEPMVLAVITLAILFFGIAFAIGVIPATGQEALMFTIKIAFVIAFATKADYLIGYGYNFLMSAIRDGSAIIVGMMTDPKYGSITAGKDIYGQIDGIIAGFFHFATDLVGVTATQDLCKNAVFAVIATMFVVLPILAYMALMLIGHIFMTIMRSIFAYIYAIVGIAFLMTMAPFFLCFYLFKHTRNLFDRWLGYLVSYVIQVVLLFACMSFALIIYQQVKEKNFLKDLTTIVIPNKETPVTSVAKFNLQYCTLCDFKVLDKDGKEITASDTSTFSPTGKLECIDPKNPKPITLNTSISPEGEDRMKQLLNLLGLGVIPLILVVYLVDKLLKISPSIAHRLSVGMGAYSATQLGGGSAQGAAVRMPGEFLADDFAAGFDKGYRSQNSDALSATYRGVTDGLSGMVTGRTAGGKDIYREGTEQQQNAGLSGAFSRWISDPSRFGH